MIGLVAFCSVWVLDTLPARRQAFYTNKIGTAESFAKCLKVQCERLIAALDLFPDTVSNVAHERTTE